MKSFPILSNIRNSRAEDLKIDEEESEDEEISERKKNLIFYDDDGNEYDEDWDKFFQPNTDNNELLQNIDEAKLLVAEELTEYCGSLASDFDDFQAVGDIGDLPEDLQNHIRLLKDVLTHYRSGPLPKTVKMLPHLPGYDSLLEMLSPLDWTYHVYPKMVKVFSAKGGQQAMQYFLLYFFISFIVVSSCEFIYLFLLSFYENYLLPKVRNDISENRRLCVQLFDSLILSIFRTEEFLSSIFLPWIRVGILSIYSVESYFCLKTYRACLLQSEMTKTEGIILSHLVRKASIKAHFSSVALVLVLEEEFSIPRSMVIEAILRKRYFLPEKAIACLVKYFVS